MRIDKNILFWIIAVLFIGSATAAQYDWIRPPSEIFFIQGNETNETLTCDCLNCTQYFYLKNQTYNITEIDNAITNGVSKNITKFNQTLDNRFIKRDRSDNVTGSFIYNWTKSNLTNIREIDHELSVSEKSLLNFSVITKDIIPRKNLCYDIGYYSQAIPSPLTSSIIHQVRFLWSDDTFVNRGNTSADPYYCKTNDSLQTSIPEQILASRDNSLNGYTFKDEKQTMFYDNSINVSHAQAVEVVDPSRIVDIWKYEISFSRPYQQNQVPKIVCTCSCPNGVSFIWQGRATWVSCYTELINQTGFTGYCKSNRGFDGMISVSFCGGSDSEVARSPLFSWHSIEREDDKTANVTSISHTTWNEKTEFIEE